jgi:hypothetical protein
MIGHSRDGITIYISNDGGKTWNIDNYNDTAGSNIISWTFLPSGQGYAITVDQYLCPLYKLQLTQEIAI